MMIMIMCIRMIRQALSCDAVITMTGQTNFDGAGVIIFKSSSQRDIHRSRYERRNFRTAGTITRDKALPVIHVGGLL